MMTNNRSGLMYGSQHETGRARLRMRHSVLHWLRRRQPQVRIEAYHGYGTPETFYIKGRVLRDPGAREIDADAGVIHNLKNTLRRALTDEVPYARVRARVGRAQTETRADSDGFFGIRLPLQAPIDASASWHELELELLDPVPRRSDRARTTAPVLVPPSTAEFGVVSDIDDTVVLTQATRLLRMLRIVLLTNAHSRMPFPHVDSLYRALQRGSDGERNNPIFYLSSSPWNFYDLLQEFFRVHDIPEGPLFLRNWNFSISGLLKMDHGEHKLVRLRHLFEVYPSLPWILIGDSGQEDPEIYREATREHRELVKAIYIRSVTSTTRDREVHEIAKEVGGWGVPMLLVRDKTEAATHAAEHGFITPEAVQRMQKDDAAPEPEADLVEKIVNPAAR